MSNSKRTTQKSPATLDSTVTTCGRTELHRWLQQQAETFELTWLLAHADDGVIWGRLDEADGLVTSFQATDGLNESSENRTYDPPDLNAASVQQARLFGEHGELLLWRETNNLRARLIRNSQDDETSDWDDVIDETYLLWGTSRDSQALDLGFTLMQEGAQGLRHAVPMIWPNPEHTSSDAPGQRLKMKIRHYLNKQGFARIEASRLVRLEDS